MQCFRFMYFVHMFGYLIRFFCSVCSILYEHKFLIEYLHRLTHLEHCRSQVLLRFSSNIYICFFIFERKTNKANEITENQPHRLFAYSLGCNKKKWIKIIYSHNFSKKKQTNKVIDGENVFARRNFSRNNGSGTDQ